jgi:DNA-binding CsgD family transcriptional regulator
MRKLREVLRLHASSLPTRQIGASLGIGQSTIIDYLYSASIWMRPARQSR